MLEFFLLLLSVAADVYPCPFCLFDSHNNTANTTVTTHPESGTNILQKALAYFRIRYIATLLIGHIHVIKLLDIGLFRQHFSHRQNNTFFINAVRIALLRLSGMVNKFIGNTQALYLNAGYTLFG